MPLIAPDMLGWAVLCLAAVLIGASKTGFPGAGILAIPLVAMVIPAKASTGLILPMLIVGDVLAVSYWRRKAVWSHLVRLIPFAMVGIVVGWASMKHMDDTVLRPLMGGILLAILGLNFWRQRRGGADLPIPTGWWFPITLGLLAGFTTMVSNAAGPIMIIYLLAMRLPKDLFVGTGAWYFLLMNTFKVPFSSDQNLINAASLQFNLWLLPMILIGAVVGIRLVKVVPEKQFNAIVQVLACIGALALLLPKP